MGPGSVTVEAHAETPENVTNGRALRQQTHLWVLIQGKCIRDLSALSAPRGHCSVIHSSQEGEATQMPTTGERIWKMHSGMFSGPRRRKPCRM